MAKKKAPNKRASRKTSTQKAIAEVISSELTERQKLFCLLYTTDAQCFGNASRSYIAAYDLQKPAEKKWARMKGHRLTTNEYIKKHIQKLFDAVFTDKGADNALAEIISQRKDLNARLGGLREYNKLKNRVKETPPVGPIVIQIAPEIAARMSLGK